MQVKPLPPIEGVCISEVPDLDDFSVYFHDLGPGEGRIHVSCYNRSWVAYWGAMGSQTVTEFVAGCDSDYLARSLGDTSPYVEKIAQAIIDALK